MRKNNGEGMGAGCEEARARARRLKKMLADSRKVAEIAEWTERRARSPQERQTLARALEDHWRPAFEAMANDGHLGDIELVGQEAPFAKGIIGSIGELAWLEDLFAIAPESSVVAMVESWVARWMGPMEFGRESGVADPRRGHCDAWGRCLSRAMARARGAGLVDACARALPLSSGFASRNDEEACDILGRALEWGMGADMFKAGLYAAGKRARDVSPSHLPVMASRLSSSFVSAARRHPRHPSEERVELGAEAFEKLCSCARVYLSWVGAMFESGEFEPRLEWGQEFPSNVRMLHICACFADWAPLSSELARLARQAGAESGWSFETLEELEVCESAGTGFFCRHPQRSSPMALSDWRGKPMGLVDIALLKGDKEAAMSLMAAGCSWEAARFIDLASRWRSIDELARGYQGMGDAQGDLARSVALAESLVIGESASEAWVSPRTARSL